ncbi:MAG TPA: PPOX class F420-dependent oxidoreductase [Ktedonobacteraceae bacterium]|nr:PPOX class F420-dependent oxidoreductase [Ktedonobacteraceae bacterium]
MSQFTSEEIEYLKSQHLGRLATVNKAGEPHVVPVTFRYNEELDTIDIGGHGIGKTKKFRDIAQNANVAFVVDDVLPPWRPRSVEIRGRAALHSEGGQTIMPDFSPELIRIVPRRVLSWGLGDSTAS